MNMFILNDFLGQCSGRTANYEHVSQRLPRSMFRDSEDEEKASQWKHHALSESCFKYFFHEIWGNEVSTSECCLMMMMTVNILLFDKLRRWKLLAKVEFEYIVASSDDELYFHNANLRQNLAADKEAMFLTALQKTFSVLACKQRMEKTHGAMSNLTWNLFHYWIYGLSDGWIVSKTNEIRQAHFQPHLRYCGVLQEVRWALPS